jgi:hypothetical protein
VGQAVGEGLEKQESAVSVTVPQLVPPGDEYMLASPSSPVWHSQKVVPPLYAMVPSLSMEKPLVGVAPVSHCHCVVGAIIALG